MATRYHRDSLSPDERAQRSLRAKRKFRAVVRLIIANLTWLQEIDDDQLGDNVMRNIQLLTRRKGKKGLLTLNDKAVLNKPCELRTEEEKHHLRRIIGNLKCFRRYPPEIKHELPGITYFCYYGANRTIVKQNYEGLNLYVILSGEVLVSVSYYDKLLKQQVTKDLNIMGPGSYFGEVSLLHGIKRTATVTTLVPSELLCIRREDFDRVLKGTVASQWKEVQKNMARFSCFKSWNETEIRESCILAKMKSYEVDEIILSGDRSQNECVYFVTKGSCAVLEYMKIRTEYEKGLPHYYLVDVEKESSQAACQNIQKQILKQSDNEVKATTSKSTVEPSSESTLPKSKLSWKKHYKEKMHFVKACVFKELACFNVGENMKNRFIVATEECDCLLLPRYFLLEKSYLTFRSIEHYLNRHIPTSKRLFELYLEDLEWRKYKQRLVDHIQSHENRTGGNSIHNVPYSIRLQEDIGEI